MTKDEATREIDAYLKRVGRALPDSFETDDLVEDIRTHILDSLQDKQDQYPDVDPLVLVKEVLSALGQPEEIAQEWGKVQTFDEEEEDHDSQMLRTVAKQSFAIVVVVAAAWFISTIPNTIVDFWTALIILMIFVIAEYFLRTWQRTEVSRIE
ncbi:MAG: hypothetical protein ACFFDR_14055, partial [Candidatus Thorarchaeota archaeon]